MSEQMETWEQKALDNHQRIVREFESGKAGIKSAVLKKGSLDLRIAKHLLEAGGGLTAAEITQDAKATKGKEWFPAEDDGSTIEFSAVLEHMLAPGTAMRRSLEAAGGFGIMDSGVTSEMNKQYVLKEQGNKYYLWCQDGVDWGAKLAIAKDKLEKAQKAASSVDQLEADITKLEAELTAQKAELNSLGLFKFSEKKMLKNKIAATENKLSSLRDSLTQAQSSKSNIPTLTRAYETAKESAKRTLGNNWGINKF